MKQFPHIISKLFYEPLIITPQKHQAICSVVEAHMASPSPMKIMDAEPDDDDPPDGFDENYQQIGSTVILRLDGVIGKHLKKMASASPGCDLDLVNAMIDTAQFDDSVKRIIFDFRSPGGSVTGVPETARKIFNVRDKETVAFTDSECCSGALWLASQCQKFYSTGSASIGSVGVWCAYLDYSRAMQNDGVNMQAFSAGKFKLLGAYWKPMTDEEKSIVQKSVQRTYEQFMQAMSSHRAVSEENFGNGLCFDGDEAAQLGFTDGLVEDMDEILERMVE